MSIWNLKRGHPSLFRTSMKQHLSLIMQLLFVVNAIGMAKNSWADYPSLPLTIQLGPNAADFNNRYKIGSIPPSSLSVLDGFDLSGRDLRLSRLHLEARELRNVNFDGADLTGSDMRETHFDGCSFRNANLRRVNLFLSDIRENCDLTGADIRGSTIWMPGDQLPTTLSYQQKNLSGCYLMGTFDGLSFSGFNLNGARLAHSLVDCDFTDASIANAVLSLSKEQLASTKEFKTRDLSGVKLEDSDFRGLDFANMSLGMFRACNLLEANFTNAVFELPLHQDPTSPTFRNGFIKCQITREQFYSTWNYKRKVLPPGFEFFAMDLRGWDFRGMDLRGVTFRASILTDAQFDDARGGIFLSPSMTAEQVKSTWNYKNNRMLEPGIRLHRDLAAEFSLQYPQ